VAIVGREHPADIIVAHSKVSSRHLFLGSIGHNRFSVRDLGSANGTYVNGRRIDEAVVTPSDELRLGQVVFEWGRYAAELAAEHADGRGYTFGRDPDNDVVVADTRASGHHASVIRTGGDYFIKDSGSRNGISVNGRQVSRARIERGDRISFGSVVVDVFGLLAARGLIDAPYRQVAPESGGQAHPNPGIGARRYEEIDPNGRRREPEPPRAVAPQVRKSGGGRGWVVAGTILCLLMAAIVGFALSKRETITAKCEACDETIFSEAAYFWNEDDVRARSHDRIYCAACAAASVEYARRTVCIRCGAEISKTIESAPRREGKQDVIVPSGYCSGTCKGAQEVQNFVDSAGGIVSDVVGALGY